MTRLSRSERPVAPVDQAINLSARELAKRAEFDQDYALGQHPAMQAVERGVCGCAYGSTAWTTRAEADQIAAALQLGPGTRLLEIGAGSGWPALYLAAETGCDVVLTDLPQGGLRIAMERAERDGLSGACRAVIADAANLPFQDACFDAVNHSDVLCCLVQKHDVLAECRRVVRPGGRMAFSVIYIPTGLSQRDHAQAAATAPEFVESEADYPTLLAQTGWRILEHHDLTEVFERSCRHRLQIEAQRHEELVPLIGATEFAARRARLEGRLSVLAQRHLRRDLFVVAPA
jgi:ubiquinone/menaquinone biosynthesis C-methylase UbiE